MSDVPDIPELLTELPGVVSAAKVLDAASNVPSLKPRRQARDVGERPPAKKRKQTAKVAKPGKAVQRVQDECTARDAALPREHGRNGPAQPRDCDGKCRLGFAQPAGAGDAAVPDMQHEFLYVAPSSIQGAGLGLFSRKRLRKNAHIGYYEGDVLPQYPRPEEVARRHGGANFMGLTRRPPWIPVEVWTSVAKPVVVDGNSIHRYANCCKGNFAVYNCGVTTAGALVPHVAIAPGDEILIWYGTSYWDERAP